MAAPPIEQVYQSQIGVMEDPLGSNWGPKVSRYLAAVHYREPAPWCAAFVAWCLDSAGIPNTVTAASGSAQNSHHLIYYQGRLLSAIEPGDVFTLFFPTLHRIGHCGFVPRMLSAGQVETVEGNSNAGGSREGIGVFHRKRPLHTLWSISRWKN